MTLSEELKWRGFVNQTTYKDIAAVDGPPISFYWGVDPSAPSMTIGNLAAAMMVRHFIRRGHKAWLLVGGATGLIGDPDGKNQERALKTVEEIATNKAAIIKQYQKLFKGEKFSVVDNYDWFKGVNYLQFLRQVGKHVPMRQMLQREFVQSRLGESGAGISYAEFSYVLIQAFDFLQLFRDHGVSLQVCGSDQWGNSIAGVDLIRRSLGAEANVWSSPLVIDQSTGVKFGKSEAGAIWLDPKMTSSSQFYQFWLNLDDAGVEGYLKIYTELSKDQIDVIMAKHRGHPAQRYAQTRLAEEVTELVHDSQAAEAAGSVVKFLTGQKHIGDATKTELKRLRQEIATISTKANEEIAEVVVRAGLAPSKAEARRVMASGGIYINGEDTTKESLEVADFINGRLLIRRGKAFKDSALVELKR